MIVPVSAPLLPFLPSYVADQRSTIAGPVAMLCDGGSIIFFSP